jgi:four helix bundle protein
MHDYKNLKFWQRAMDMAQMVFELTKDFPQEERYGLTSQLRRAAVSVPSNIAEGAGRGTNADFKRFLDIANASLNEVETQLLLAERFGLTKKENIEKICIEVDQIQKMIYSFRLQLK